MSGVRHARTALCTTVLLVAFAAAAPAFGSVGTAAAPSLKVRLVDEAKGTRLTGGGMGVRIRDTSTGATKQTVVDKNGEGTFPGLASGSAWTLTGIGGRGYADDEYWQAPNGSMVLRLTTDTSVTVPRRHAPGVYKDVVRLAGHDRFDTSVQVAKEYFPGWQSTTDVIIACGDGAHAADALTAGPMAGAYDCPMLLVHQNGIPSLVRSALRAMPKGLRVHIVGSTRAVSKNVASALTKMANVESVERFGGGDRYATAAAVARTMKKQLASDFVQKSAFLVNGENGAHFWDAVSASAPAYNMDVPILFVSDSAVPAATTAVMKDLGLTDRYVIGSSSAVSESVRKAADVPSSHRLGGSTRYATASVVSEYSVKRKWLRPGDVAVVATIPDALCSAAMVGSKLGPLLLTRPGASSIQSDAQSFFTRHKADVDCVFACGGTSGVTEKARLGLMSSLNK